MLTSRKVVRFFMHLRIRFKIQIFFFLITVATDLSLWNDVITDIALIHKGQIIFPRRYMPIFDVAEHI